TERGFVVMVLEGGRAKSRTVETGLWTGEAVEILKGLTAGETVVVDGASGLRDGVEVDSR
ncbi:MAG TPA: efflux RND transporter periplasmic adaptor subunit, partial [Planctomycetota bacterium]|nr:efflux RND transporter periplasmic adaptor subunit [Planctomycetota bacterium]